MSLETLHIDITVTPAAARKAAITYLMDRLPANAEPSLRELRSIACYATREELDGIIADQVRLEGLRWELSEHVDYALLSPTSQCFIDSTVESVVRSLFPEVARMPRRSNRYVFGRTMDKPYKRL